MRVNSGRHEGLVRLWSAALVSPGRHGRLVRLGQHDDYLVSTENVPLLSKCLSLSAFCIWKIVIIGSELNSWPRKTSDKICVESKCCSNGSHRCVHFLWGETNVYWNYPLCNGRKERAVQPVITCGRSARFAAFVGSDPPPPLSSQRHKARTFAYVTRLARSMLIVQHSPLVRIVTVSSLRYNNGLCCRLNEDTVIQNDLLQG